MKIYYLFNRFQNSLSLPYLFSSLLLTLYELIYLVSLSISGTGQQILYNVSQLLISLIPFVFTYFITLDGTSKKREIKAFWSVICLLVLKNLYNVGDSRIIITMAILICFSNVFFFEHLNIYVSMIISLVVSILVGISFSGLYTLFHQLVIKLSDFVSGKGIMSAVLFSVCFVVFSLFDIDLMNDMFFYKQYGGSIIIDNNAVTGIIDLFNSGYRGKLLSVYSSSRYLLILSFIGIAIAMFKTLSKERKITLATAVLSAVISGKPVIFLMFLFLECPFIILSVIMLAVLSSVAVYLLDLQIGIVNSGGIFELFTYINKPIYFITAGAVIFAMGYFMTRLAIEKKGLTDSLNIYIPSRLKKTVNALGGVMNIIRLKKTSVEIRNPKIIDQLMLDCKIEENCVILDEDIINDLKEYLC